MKKYLINVILSTYLLLNHYSLFSSYMQTFHISLHILYISFFLSLFLSHHKHITYSHLLHYFLCFFLSLCCVGWMYEGPEIIYELVN